MRKFEVDYANMIHRIIKEGTRKATRNGETKSVFGESLVVDDIEDFFPIIQGRQMYPKGVLGELAAMLRQPKSVEDFEKWGCNYWKLWADEDGKLDVDYGNAWFNFDGFDQIAALKDSLRNNPNDRRMIVSSWRPNRLKDLSLPCCHYSYQFHVADGKINMIWSQRSVDMMIGLPSDIILAAAWLIAIAREFKLKPGRIKMDLGDCHVYQEHYDAAMRYCYNVLEKSHLIKSYPRYEYTAHEGYDFTFFEPKHLLISEYDSFPKMQLELKG